MSFNPAAPDAIKTTPVNSSKLQALGYDAGLFILRAAFNPSGALYDYFDVEPERYQALLAAKSLGVYFGENIAGKRGQPPPYKYAKVGTPGHAALWADATATTLSESESTAAMANAPTVADLNQQPGKVLDMPAQPGTRIVEALPPQKSRSQQLADVHIEEIPPVELPSDQEGLEKRAVEVVKETEGLVLIKPGAPAVLSVKTPEHYAHVVSIIVATKAEMKRALEEVAKIKNPATEAWKAACAFENKVKASYEAKITTLDQAAVGYRNEVAAEERRAAEAERKREQDRLDAEHAEATRIANQEAAAQAETLRSAGQHEVAAEVEKAPAYVPRQTAAPVVHRTEVPAVAGARITKTWKFRIDDATLIPRFYMPEIASALQRHGLTMTENQLGSFTMELGRIFSALHSVDEVKVGGRVRPLKEAAVNLIPGVTVWPDEKTGSTGR